MAGRGRGATLPAWMTQGGGGGAIEASVQAQIATVVDNSRNEAFNDSHREVFTDRPIPRENRSGSRDRRERRNRSPERERRRSRSPPDRRYYYNYIYIYI